MTNNTTNYSDTIVAFHLGGAQGGQYTFLPDITSLQECVGDGDFRVYEDENGNALPDNQWTIQNCNGDVLLQGRVECEAKLGWLERDGNYDTDIVCTLADVRKGGMMDALYKAYRYEDIRKDNDERFEAIYGLLKDNGYSMKTIFEEE